MKTFGRYLFNALFVLPFALLDFAGNALTGGSPFETISARTGRVKLAYGDIPKKRYFLRFVEWLTEKVDSNHVIEAAKTRLGTMGVIDRPEDLDNV